MNPELPLQIIERLFSEKVRVLRAFLEVSQQYAQRFKGDDPVDQKMDWVDELSDLREAHFRTLQAMDQEIDTAKKGLNKQNVESLQVSTPFRSTLEETLSLVQEIQLTDQSLFLYIQNMGFELRAQILRSLKEKEALSKFKSQTQTTGEGLDQTV
jgi:hypothetical protein